MAIYYSTTSSNSVPSALSQLGAVSLPSLPAEIRINPAQFATLSFAEIEAMRRCAGSEWRVYSVLALHANNEGECWPGRQRISAMADLLPDHVSRALGKLEGRGLIQRRTSPTGLTVYTLPLHRTLPKLVAAPAEPLPELVGITDQNSTDQREQATETPVSEPPAPVTLSQDLHTIKTAPPDGLPESWVEQGRLMRPDLDEQTIRNSGAIFLDTARANGRQLVDWQAGFNAWLRRERAPKAPPMAQKPLSTPAVPSPYLGPNFGTVAQETAQEAAARFAATMERYGATPGEGGTWNRPGAAVPSPAPIPMAATIPPTRRMLTAEEQRRLAELVAGGLSRAEVAATLGRG